MVFRVFDRRVLSNGNFNNGCAHTTKTARFLFGNFFLPKITFIPKQYLFIVNMYHYQQTTTIDHRARKIELATLTMKLIWNLFQLTSSVKLNLIFFRSFFVRVFWTAKICIKMFAISLCWKCFVFFIYANVKIETSFMQRSAFECGWEKIATKNEIRLSPNTCSLKPQLRSMQTNSIHSQSLPLEPLLLNLFRFFRYFRIKWKSPRFPIRFSLVFPLNAIFFILKKIDDRFCLWCVCGNGFGASTIISLFFFSFQLQ